MIRVIWLLLLVQFCAQNAIAAVRADATEVLPAELTLFVGDSQLLNAAVSRAAIGNGKVLSVSTPERDQVLLLGEAAGTTTLQLWLRGGERRRIKVNVVEMDLSLRLEQVQRLLDGTRNIDARVAGNRIVLEGLRVSDADQARAATITESYPGTVLNFIGKVGWETMIQMQVRIVEVRRDRVKELGIRWDNSVAGPIAGVALGEPVSSSLPDSVKPSQAFFSLASQITSRIDLLQRQGYAATLAEPTLSCRSGGAARFVSGGEVPIPITDGLGATDVQYKEYGVILEVRPRSDASGTIYAEIDAELSQIDQSVKVLSFPGFLKRKSSTAVNLKAGETVVIAGLLANESSRDRQAVPGLGRLFSARQSRSRQSELLVLITPRLLPEALGVAPEPDVQTSRQLDRAQQLGDEAARSAAGARGAQ